MMPNKTIYVKDADLPLFEQAQELLGDSVSALFAEFLKERVGRVAPEERMADLVNQISKKRDAIKHAHDLPPCIDAVFAQAEAYAKKAVKSLRVGEVRKAKALYYAANVYVERGERDVKETRDLGEKFKGLIEA
jgi:hypothetical protein